MPANLWCIVARDVTGRIMGGVCAPPESALLACFHLHQLKLPKWAVILIA
jgi:hypothetical protein